MTGIDAPTLWQVTYTVAGVAVASAAAGLLASGCSPGGRWPRSCSWWPRW